ncbi:MAG: hypothetical protein AB7T31_00630 [Gemmatimonadales bacterium]
MSPAGPIVLRVLVTLVAAVATVSQVAYLDALSWHRLGFAHAMTARMNGSLVAVMTGHALVSLVAAVLAVMLVLHEGPRQRAARGLGLSMAAWSYLTAYSGATLLLMPNAAPWRAVFDGHFLAVEMVGLIGLLRFTALFPKPLADIPSEPPAALPPILRPLHAASVWMQKAWPPWLVGALVLIALWSLTASRGAPLGDAGLSPWMDVVRFLAAGLVVINLRRSWSHASREEAARLTWLLAGLAFLSGVLLLLIGGNVLLAVTDWPEPGVTWRPLLIDLGLAGFLASLTMSVLHDGRVDATVAATRIGAVATVVTLGLFLAAALEALFTGALEGLSLGTGVGTLLAFVVVLATHRGMIRSIERMLTQMRGGLEHS